MTSKRENLPQLSFRAAFRWLFALLLLLFLVANSMLHETAQRNLGNGYPFTFVVWVGVHPDQAPGSVHTFTAWGAPVEMKMDLQLVGLNLLIALGVSATLAFGGAWALSLQYRQLAPRNEGNK